MGFRLAADTVVVLHLGFVVFVVLGGLLVLRWRRVAWVHVPAAAWGAAIELGGWVCPLTPLENWLRRRGGQDGYTDAFVDQYVMPVLYPVSLTREMQIGLAAVVVAVNLVVYGLVVARARPGRE